MEIIKSFNSIAIQDIPGVDFLNIVNICRTGHALLVPSSPRIFFSDLKDEIITPAMLEINHDKGINLLTLSFREREIGVGVNPYPFFSLPYLSLHNIRVREVNHE